MSRWAQLLVLVAAGAAGCSQVDGTIEPPDLDFNRMLDQPRYESYRYSPWFENGSTMQHPPEGTVPFVGAERYVAAGEWPPAEEYPLDRQLLEQGQEAFARTCAACHGITGHVNDPVADRMELRPPPSLHEERLRHITVERLRRIMREGYGLMPSYESMLDRRERFAVAHYVKALQLSQHARVDDLPSDVWQELEEASE